MGYPTYAKIAIGVDEESGADSKFGLLHMLNEGLRAKSAIYTYGSSPNTITVGHRGLVRYSIRVQGEATHSGSLAWQQGKKGASAITALIHILTQLDSLPPPSGGDGTYFEGYGFMQTITMMKGGVGESIVPPVAEALIDVRLLPGQNPETYLTAVEALCAAAQTEKIHAEVQIKNNIPGVVVDEQSQIVQILKAQIAARGLTPIIKGAGPANEGYMLMQKGIPTICGNGVAGEGFHMVNEYMLVESIAPTLETYVQTAVMLHQHS